MLHKMAAFTVLALFSDVETFNRAMVTHYACKHQALGAFFLMDLERLLLFGIFYSYLFSDLFESLSNNASSQCGQYSCSPAR